VRAAASRARAGLSRHWSASDDGGADLSRAHEGGHLCFHRPEDVGRVVVQGSGQIRLVRNGGDAAEGRRQDVEQAEWSPATPCFLRSQMRGPPGVLGPVDAHDHRPAGHLARPDRGPRCGRDVAGPHDCLLAPAPCPDRLWVRR
jgi:hypothetical protein